MTAINAEGIKSSLTDDGSIADTVATLVEIVEEQQKQIEELQDRLDEEQTQRGKDDAELRGRITDAEDRLDTVEDDVSGETTPSPETETDASTDTQTPIEDVIRIPEHLVEESLTANQQRSRAVAKDIHQYSRSVPAGRAIKSSELRRVLSAQSDGGPTHTETVSRVMDMLDDLGKDAINVRTSQSGEKVVVFDEDLVKRIVAHQNDHGVVADATGGAGAET
jgi:TolA-binding protein